MKHTNRLCALAVFAFSLVGCGVYPSSVTDQTEEVMASEAELAGKIPVPASGAYLGTHATGGGSHAEDLRAFENLIRNKVAIDRLYFHWDSPLDGIRNQSSGTIS